VRFPVFERVAKEPRAVVVRAALEEVRRRGDRRIGTEHLFLGLLHDPNSVPARATGVDLEAARAALDALDQAALASVGIDVGGLRPPSLVPARRRAPLTSAARSVLQRSIKEATSAKTRRHVTAKHLLLALLACEQPDPAADLMAKLGIDRSAVRNRIGKSDT
jgi:ATP-dependent Clp protease ATP-binding subunit ClpA